MLARAIYVVLGLLFLAVGIAGYIIPGLPGTPLLLVAAWFFSLSNDRLYNWMTTNRWFGQTIADYRAGLGISRKVKTIAISSMSVVVPISVLVGPPNWGFRLSLITLALIGAVFVITRPTRKLGLEPA